MAKICSSSLWWIITLLALCFNSIVWEKTDFFYTLLPNENLCFEEILTKDIGVHSTVFCNSQTISLRIYDPEERQIYYRERQPIMDTSFVAPSAGFYKFCVLNYAKEYTQIEVQIRSGVDAKNYDSLVTQKKLKPIELQAQKIEDMSKEIKSVYRYANTRDNQLRSQIKNSGRTLYITGFLSIAFMILSTIVSVWVLRFYFNKKKKM